MRYKVIIRTALLTLIIVIAGFSHSEAMMGGTGGTSSGTGSTSGMMNGAVSSEAMMNKQWFNMTSGMTNTPVVASNGTAYVVSYGGTATNSTSSRTYSYSYESTISAITTAGNSTSVTLEGIVSTPVVSGSTMVLTSSLSGYMMDFNSGSSNSQLTLYILSLPFTSSSTPVSVSLDGDFASAPVISGSHIYVTTTDVGFTSANASYLYILNFDGSQVAKVAIQ
ncbi:MAG: hypothetical protein HQL08_13720 [Nitrospirae bacterium]|nr:hypothetical protein [Nitrospirota bacterium]